MRSKITWSLIGGGLPLLVYPAVLFAGVMSLAGEPTGDVPLLVRAVVTSFLLGSIIYPLVYIPSAIKALGLSRAQEIDRAYRMSQVPLKFLLVLGALLLVWFLLEALGKT